MLGAALREKEAGKNKIPTDESRGCFPRFRFVLFELIDARDRVDDLHEA